MAKSVERRAGHGRTENQPDPHSGVDMRQDRSLRRVGPGNRMMSDYFSADNMRKPVMRGELLGILEMLAFHERERHWWWRFRRWVTGRVSPDDTWARMAMLFERRVIEPAIAAVKAELEEQGRQALEAAGKPAPGAGAVPIPAPRSWWRRLLRRP